VFAAFVLCLLLLTLHPADRRVVRNTIRADQPTNEKHTGILQRVRNISGLNEG
jgi:hypothetical protein